MTTLRQLSQEMAEVQSLALDPELPETALVDTLDAMSGIFNDKAIKVVHVIANSDPDIEAIDQEIKRLQGRKKIIQSAQARLRDYLRYNMEKTGINKIESPLFTITLAMGRDIAVVDDVDSLPDDMVRVKTTIDPDKGKILSALQNGIDIPGARMEKSKSSVRIE